MDRDRGLPGRTGRGGGTTGVRHAIYVSLFFSCNAFAANMWLQYRRAGPWREYRFGERAYLVLSLTAKSLLAWQVFAASLAPS